MPDAGFEIHDDIPEPDDAAIARLAAMPTLEYERARSAEAVRMHIRPGVLDRLVKAARAEAQPGDGKPAQGRSLTIPPPVPWHDPVDGADLLGRLAGFFARHVHLPPGAADAMAAWTVHTYCVGLFRHSPRIALTSPEKRCGKTTALDALALVVAKPLPTANVTAAALFRTIEAASPTLLIDEADTFLRDNEDLRGVLNAGHKRGGQVIRCVGDDAEPRAFAVFGPCAIAAIGRLPGTIEDRSIIVRMVRATSAERPEPLDRHAEAEALDVARRCRRWVEDYADALADAAPNMPAGTFNRAAANIRPLLTIAEAAGGDWPARIAAAAEALAGDGDDAEGRGVRLLADIRTIFDQRGTDRLSSAELSGALAEIETSPWPDCHHGKPITPAYLSRLLRPFGVIPGTVRIGSQTPKGYARAAFASAWLRYLDPDTHTPPPPTGPQTATTPQAAEMRGSDDSQTATPTDHVAERKSRNAANPAACGGVADQNPMWREEDDDPYAWRRDLPHAHGFEAEL